MKNIIDKLARVCGHEASPQKMFARDWKPYLKPQKGSQVDGNLNVYLRECLFEKPLNLTFSLYSLKQLQKFIKSDDLFELALAEGWFVIGDRDGTLICVHVTEGTVCLIPAWSISEGQFVKEKRFKSLETFVKGQIKHEKQAAKEAAEDNAEKAAKKKKLAAVGDVNALDADGNTLLMLAASDDDLKSVRSLLKQGADPNVPGRRTALLRAIQQRNAKMVKLLVEQGADVNNGGELRSPMEEAATCGILAIVKTLVEAGADIQGEVPRTPLAMAVHYNDIPLTRYLLDQGVDLNIVLKDVGSHGPQTVLSQATQNPEMVQLLLKNGADPKACPRILTGRVSSADTAMAKKLLKAGAILDPVDLHRCRIPEMLNLLLDAGADINVISHNATPLMKFSRIAMMEPKKNRPPYLEMIQSLIARGADVNLQAGRGNTALHVAIKENYGEAVQAILEAEPDVTLKNDRGQLAADLLPNLRPKALREKVQRTIESLG